MDFYYLYTVKTVKVCVESLAIGGQNAERSGFRAASLTRHAVT